MNRRALYFWLGLTTLPGFAVPSSYELDPGLLDARYPAMAQWALAGVAPSVLKVQTSATVHLEPGADLAEAVTQPDRLVLLDAGTYPVTQTLRLAPGVVLRGAGPSRTRLVVKLRGTVPPDPATGTHSTWNTGLLLDAVANCGIASLTVAFDDTLPPPPDPSQGPAGYENDARGQTDLHVVLVRLTASQNCWLYDCRLENSGDHPLIIEASRHISVEGTDIAGAYNKSKGAGCLNLMGSEYCLLDGLTVRNINHVLLQEDAAGRPCRYNVIVNSTIEDDVRFRDAGTSHNLLQNCAINVPGWHNFPPLSVGAPDEHERAPGTGNLVFLCNVTRNFTSVQRSFSIADNPDRVYEVINRFTSGATVTDAGSAPASNTLWPVR